MLALVDADTPCVSAALSAKDSPLWVATSRLDKTIDNILEGSGCSSYKLFVSGGHNFRYDIDPLYKANRPKEAIKWREECKQHLITQWGAIETDGYEADDAVGCEQKYDGSTIICGIDKDLLMIAGKHYQWPIIRGGEIVREALFHDITHEQGMRTFFEQVLTGDNTDNIIGLKGVGPVKAGKILEECETEEEMFLAVLDYYTDQGSCFDIWENRFYNNCNLLWIWRSLGETYTLRREFYG
jgi:5'-3' exonuclease